MSLILKKTAWEFDPAWLRVEACDADGEPLGCVYFERNANHRKARLDPVGSTCGVAKPDLAARFAARWKSLCDTLTSAVKPYWGRRRRPAQT